MSGSEGLLSLWLALDAYLLRSAVLSTLVPSLGDGPLSFFLVDDYSFIITHDICCVYNKIFILLVLIRRLGLGNFSICCVNKSLIYYLKLISWEECSVTLLYYKHINGPVLAVSV